MNNYIKECPNCYNIIYDNKYSNQTNKYYERPNLTTDALVVKKSKNNENKHEILLIQRKNEPYKGKLAFPGGFVDYNENPKDACLRELKEETNIHSTQIELFTVKTNPKRDVRKHIVSIVFEVKVNDNDVPNGSDDADTAKFYDLEDVMKEKDIYSNTGKNAFAFDHYDIIKEYIQKYKIFNI